MSVMVARPARSWQVWVRVPYIELKFLNMIYFDGKKWGKSFEALLSSKSIEADEDEVIEIKKLIRKGQDIYTSINPYASEISCETILIWDTDEETLVDRCNRLAEDI